MKKIILVLMVFPFFAFAETTVHQDEFKLSNASEGSHFWARLYKWKSWSQTEKQKNLGLKTNFVKAAYDAGEGEYERTELDEDEMFEVFGGVEGPALYEFYEEREERHEDDPLDPEDIEVNGPSGLTAALKVSVELPADFDLENLGLDRIYKLIARSDRPHIHKEVSKDFVHSFVDSLHSAHASVDRMRKGKVVLSIINMGDEYYQCSELNKVLKWKGDLDGITTYDGSFRTYVLNTVEELDLNSDYRGKNLIEGEPLKVFKQEIIYSSNLIKSGVNFLAFYKSADGKKRMVLNSVVVTTPQADKVPNNLVNGIGLVDELFSGIEFEGGIAKLDSNNVDLKPKDGSCSKGLAQGMGRYILGLADSIVKWSLLIK